MKFDGIITHYLYVGNTIEFGWNKETLLIHFKGGGRTPAPFKRDIIEDMGYRIVPVPPITLENI